MVNLIPSPEIVMQILKRTGAYREGHFITRQASTRRIFPMPLAFR